MIAVSFNELLYMANVDAAVVPMRRSMLDRVESLYRVCIEHRVDY